MKNHLGSYECRLCLTIHTNEGSYLGHTQGKKHQANLARRAARENAGNALSSVLSAAGANSHVQNKIQTESVKKRQFVPIGRPGYKIIKVRDPENGLVGLLFMLHYPQIASNSSGGCRRPRHRIMSAFEQHVEVPNRTLQYLVVSGEPYETVAFRIPARNIDSDSERTFSHWDPDAGLMIVQIMYSQ